MDNLDSGGFHEETNGIKSGYLSPTKKKNDFFR